MKYIREKKHRLDPGIYIGERPITFTLCLKYRKSFITDIKRFSIFEEMLYNELNSFNCSAYVYLFMPDHVHMTLAGNKSDSNIKKCLGMFKQKTGYWLGKNHSDFKWQKDYYDHILRSKENLDIHIKYILNNPVRTGLVEYWHQYLFKGSTIYNFNKWSKMW
ncbi:MAG: transposase [Ignavibacteria bacterium]|jgi:REP element-mobilizing transposase RayT